MPNTYDDKPIIHNKNQIVIVYHLNALNRQSMINIHIMDGKICTRVKVTKLMTTWVHITWIGIALACFQVAGCTVYGIPDPTGGDVDSSKVMNTLDSYITPQSLGGPMSDYPNRLNITEELRRKFYPVVRFPMEWVNVNSKDQLGVYRAGRVKVPKYEIIDCTKISGDAELILPHRQEDFRKKRRNRKLGLLSFPFRNKNYEQYSVGKYDENRVNLYSSDHFKNNSNSIDGYSGARTVHIGIDLGGPVGTKVYSFWDGVIHSAGYNEALGDYGYVIIVQYHIPLLDISEAACVEKGYTTQINGMDECREKCHREDKHNLKDGARNNRNLLWALYGHLDSGSVKNKKRGQKVKRGQLLGRLGDVHENGGWSMPHVHFQLSAIEPETHDMPGAVKMVDRARALINYPDPRLVLGPLY